MQKCVAIVFEPIAAFCVVRQDARNLRPETPRMVHFLHMTKLVHDDIIAHRLRRQQEQRIETDRAAAGTASPARMLCANGELRRMDAKTRRPFFQPCAKIHLRRFSELRQLLRRKRRSTPVALPARKVRIVSLSLTGGEKGRFMFDVECGGGTYIRALARDIAEALGTVGYMSALRRTRSGVFAIEDAVDIDEFRRAPEEHILPVEYALGGFSSVTVDGEEEKRITNGIPLKEKGVKEGEYCTVYAPDRLLGVGLAGKDGLRLGVRL